MPILKGRGFLSLEPRSHDANSPCVQCSPGPLHVAPVGLSQARGTNANAILVLRAGPW